MYWTENEYPPGSIVGIEQQLAVKTGLGLRKVLQKATDLPRCCEYSNESLYFYRAMDLLTTWATMKWTSL